MSSPFTLSDPALVVRTTAILVRGLRIDAEIGVNDDERGRTQTLLIDVELLIRPVRGMRLSDTVDYCAVLNGAKSVAACGHIALVETFADMLCRSLLTNELVESVDVTIAKPSALAPSTAEAGVRLVMARASRA